MMIIIGLLTFVVGMAGIHGAGHLRGPGHSRGAQYLLTALSLAEDANLDISDELAEERFREFHELGLNPQTIELNQSGQRLSPHDPGLPLLLPHR